LFKEVRVACKELFEEIPGRGRGTGRGAGISRLVNPLGGLSSTGSSRR
jgi:hypothetical protein